MQDQPPIEPYQEEEEVEKKASFFNQPWMHRLRNWMRRYHVLKFFMALVLTCMLFFTAYLVYGAKTADVSSLKQGMIQETLVYDRTGQEAGSLNLAKGEYLTLDQISPNVINALISTEDKRFYSHFGVDPIGILRAMVGYVTNMGNIVGGGSTITQQLAKNAYLTLDQTLMRKAKELFLSFEIEKVYTKDEILEMYLNNAYFGNGAYGIQNASLRYFGVNAADLDLSQAAILVGALKAPSYYNPIDNLEATVNRRATVLSLMVANKVLDQETANATASQDIYLSDQTYIGSKYTYPYYFDAVIDEIVNDYGISEEDLFNKGYQIYTGLDQNMQADMEETFANAWAFPSAEDGTVAQGASIALEPTTGDVLALVGGRVDDTYVYRGFNRATQMRVQPGSTFKPLAVYTLALEEGYTPQSILVDEKRSYGSDNYTPENWNRQYQGSVTMAEAISLSWNAPAVWLLDQIGLEKGIEKVHQFGIETTADDAYLGIALGGLTKGVSPMQMASAYTTFANGGLRAQARLVTKILDANGRVVVDNTTPKTNRVTSPQVAQTMTSMLLNVFAPGGGGATAAPVGYQIAGKTGTTETVNGQDGSRDQWMIGYTPDMVVATWMGYDDSAKYSLALSSVEGVGPLFQMEMGGLLQYTPATPFSVEAASTQAPEPNLPNIQDVVEQVKETGQNIWNSILDATNNLRNRIFGQ